MNRYLLWVTGILAFVSIFLLSACNMNENIEISNQDKNTETSKELKIVTAFPPLYSHVANLIDGNDEIVNLVPPGTSVHFWQPTPQDVLAMQNADIIITNGLNLEEFLDGYLEDLEAQWVVILDTSEGVNTINFDEHEDISHKDDHDHESEEDHSHEDEDEHSHTHEWADPHIWLDVENAIIQTKNILEALISLDIEQEEYLRAKGDIYINNLRQLDSEIQNMMSETEIEPFVVFHNAYQYFLQAYGIQDKQVGVISNFHADNPSQKEIAELIESIKEYEVWKIFTEPQFNPSVVKALVEEVWIQTAEINPIWSTLDKDWYITTMENIANWFIQNNNSNE